MTKKLTRRRKVYYKSVVMPSAKNNLQELLQLALQEGSLVYLAKDRHQLINSSSKDFILLNHHTTYNGMLFGQLVFVEYDVTKTFLTLDETTQEYSIEPFDMAKIQGKTSGTKTEDLKNQFINSILYFGVFENHLVLMQSPALKANHLEDYLKWLLSNAGLFDATEFLSLSDKVNEESQKILKKNPAKSLRIGANLDNGMDIIKTLIGADKLKGLKLKDNLDSANLKMYVVMTYNNKTTESGQKVIDTVANALRNMPDDDYQIVLKNGGTIKAGELRISKELTLDTINGVINESNLWSQMHTWLMGNISPTT
ncbi:hypothetical protein [Acinetobacter baumannii]|uniref:hypothetical protein n=1 Tax=Acinetobacter baumannii TaxID=470 RepID=UPI0007D8C23E|nr:hypothetical protein [Acinetobacter baumannii]